MVPNLKNESFNYEERCQLVKNRQESAKSCLSASQAVGKSSKPIDVTASSGTAYLFT